MTSEELKAGTRRGVVWGAASTGGLVLIHLLQLAVLARFLEAGDFGRMAVVLVVLSVGSIFSEMGLSSAIIHRQDPTRAELATLYTVNIVAGAAVYLAAWSVAPYVEIAFDFPNLTDLIRVAALVLLIAPWAIQIRALLQKGLDFKAIAGCSLLGGFLGLLAATISAVNGLGVWSLVVAGLVTESVSCIAFLAYGIRKGLHSGFGRSIAAIRPYLSFGAYRIVAQGLNTLNSRADQLVIGSLLGANALGLYSVSHRIASEPAQKLNPVVTRVAFPVFAIVQTDRQSMRHGFLRMINLLLAVTAPLLLGIAALADLAIEVLLGSAWSGATPVVRWLAGYALFRGILNACGALLLGAGKANWTFRWNVCLIFVIPASVWLAARYGSIITVAATLFAVQMVLVVPHYFFMLRKLLGPCGIEYLAAFANPIGISSVMALCILLLSHALPMLAPEFRLAVLVFFGGAIYLGLSFLFQKHVLEEALQLARRRNQ